MIDKKLSHLDAKGRLRMVDVSGKNPTKRCAVAEGRMGLGAEVARVLRDGDTPKGNVLEAARLAGILAAKKTADLIPLCHTLALDSINLDFGLEGETLHIQAVVVSTGLTGVEMEALTAVSIAALTVYDMLKAVSHEITIEQVRLISKSGGRSGDCRREKISR